MNFVSKTNIFDFFGTLVGKRKQTIFKKRWFDITTPLEGFIVDVLSFSVPDAKKYEEATAYSYNCAVLKWFSWVRYNINHNQIVFIKQMKP
jgi:hypothetical protein